MAYAQTTMLSAKLEECTKCLQSLQRINPVQEIFLPQFKRFLKCLSDCLPDIQEAFAQPCNKLCRPKSWLCLSQMIKILRLFASYSMTRQTLWYLNERILWCITELSRTLASGIAEPNESLDSFVHCMDLAHQLLDSDEAPTSDTWLKAVHDLVCHAVTIAKVALPTDAKEIHFSCQQLLVESERLANDGCPDSFQVDVISHNLNTLEQRVNTTVLRLLLEIFSDPNKPLKKIISNCGKAAQPRNLSDLDVMISELDGHIERIMLIGQYTLACCENTTYKVRMKCCLASLESVDNYLVPAVTAFYVEPDCADKRDLVKLLCDHWQQEMTLLHSHIDLIVDSEAFAKVTERNMKEMGERLQDEGLFIDLGCAIVNQGLLLHRHLTRSPDSPISEKHLRLFKEALCQCQYNLKHQADPKTAALKIRKITSLVEYFSGCLGQFYHNTNSSNITDSSNSCSVSGDSRCKQNTFKVNSICNKSLKCLTPKWKSNLSNVSSNAAYTNDITDPKTPTTSKSVMDVMTPYLNRVVERSTNLYSRTPRKFVQSQIMQDEDSTVVESSEAGSLAIDVTDILESLSKLADTLSSEQELSIISQPNSTASNPIVSSELMSVSTNDPVISLDSLDISVPQRLQDIQDLDEKIRMLKMV